MISKIYKIFAIGILTIISTFSSLKTQAQEAQKDTTIRNYSSYKRALSFSGLVQTRYTLSLDKNVDVNGKHFEDKGITNSFSLKRVRFQVKAQINDRLDAAILANFADFTNSNMSNKVLENAFIRYSLNRYLNVIAGQFRPYFGIEDAVPVDIIKSLDYSNQYTAFGNSGWQSFQTGVTVYGDLNKADKMPIRYYVGIHNGNNRNKATDDDNQKHMYARFEVSPVKNLIIGANAGSGSVNNETGYAWGGDFKSTIKLQDKLKLELSGEYKEGNNLDAYKNYSTELKPALDQVKMKGFYVFPNLRYEYKHPRLRAFEFSARYEYFDNNYKQSNNNPRQTITPMFALEFADNFFATLQFGVSIDLFKSDIPLTTQYSHNTAVTQLQIRF